MGYRILIAVFTLALMISCAAFEDGGPAMEGFGPNEIPLPGGNAGIYTGHYVGTMALDTNTCQSVSDEIGADIPLEFDVTQTGTTVNIVFADDSVSAGTLTGENTTLMTTTGSAKRVYYLTFAKNQASGTSEIIEADEAGQYGAACASYTVSTSKAE